MPRKAARMDQFLLIHSSRTDNWREISTLADAWAAQRGERAAVEAMIAEMAPAEEYHAYPGARLLGALSERIAADDASGAAKLARRISNGLLTRAYRGRPGEWDVHDEMSSSEVADIMPPATGEPGGRRPYFEVLFVNSQPAARWPALAGEIRQAAPAGRFVHLRANLRRFLRGCALRRSAESRHHFGRSCRRLPLSLAT